MNATTFNHLANSLIVNSLLKSVTAFLIIVKWGLFIIVIKKYFLLFDASSWLLHPDWSDFITVIIAKKLLRINTNASYFQDGLY